MVEGEQVGAYRLVMGDVVLVTLTNVGVTGPSGVVDYFFVSLLYPRATADVDTAPGTCL